MNSASQNFRIISMCCANGCWIRQITNWPSIIFLRSSPAASRSCEVRNGTDAASGGGAEHRCLQSHEASGGGGKRARIVFAETLVRARQRAGGRAYRVVLLL